MPANSERSSVEAGQPRHAPLRRDDASIRNEVLRLLPPAELEAVLERTEMVTIESKEIVWEPDKPIRFVHFPEDCVISLVTALKSGDKVEAMTKAIVGFEVDPVEIRGTRKFNQHKAADDLAATIEGQQGGCGWCGGV